MKKSVYSIVLMDDIVSKIDRIAYSEGTSRSNMINRILAQYANVSLPEQHMQNVFSEIDKIITDHIHLHKMVSASDTIMCMRSAVKYKYNPSIKYSLEVYAPNSNCCGILNVSMRTQNKNLLLCLNNFFQIWQMCEQKYLPNFNSKYEIETAKYKREFNTPDINNLTCDNMASIIVEYISLLDKCLKKYFYALSNNEDTAALTEQTYINNLNYRISQI